MRISDWSSDVCSSDLMELYKKEKINPVGGCLPVLPQMIIFMALYWVLMESVELRQAPWTLWIQDLTARDPYFILPVLNIAIMWSTQKLTDRKSTRLNSSH